MQPWEITKQWEPNSQQMMLWESKYALKIKPDGTKISACFDKSWPLGPVVF